MPDIIAIGECMIELFASESIATASNFHKAYGGDTLNTLVAASRLGTSTGYITRVGEDPFKDFLLEQWSKEKIDLSKVTTVQGQNAVYFITLSDDGQRDFTYYRKGSAASTLCPEDIDEDYIAGSRLLHVTGISQSISSTCRNAIKKAVKVAKKHGKLVSYDPNLRLRLWTIEEAREALDEILPYVDFFLPSEEDAISFLGRELGPEKVVKYFREAGAPTVVIKCGDRGCLVGHNESITAIEAVEISKVVDTTGAGDAFNGGFLHGILNGMDSVTAARLGTVVAGLKLETRGAIAGLPSADMAYHRFQTLDA